jgi:hypothetical protein
VSLLLALQGGPLPHPEIPAPPEVAAGLSWPLVIGTGLAGLLGVMLLIWLIFKPKALSAIMVEKPLRQALKALIKLRSQVDVQPASHIAAEVSATLRRYFLLRYGMPAPYRTTQELYPQGDHQQEGLRRMQWRERFSDLATVYDAMEFSATQVSVAEVTQLLDAAIARLEEERLQNDDAA